MAEDLSLIALYEPGEVSEFSNFYSNIIGLTLDIYGQPLHFKIAVADSQAAPADIVPLAQTISKKIAETVVDKNHRESGCVPCCRGCDSCCRYLVPLSIPEAFYLRNNILSMPANLRRQMQRASILAARQILNRKPPRLNLSSSDTLADLSTLSSWYSGLQLDCPFLDNGACAIYQQRPLACIEHFIKGSAGACKGTGQHAEVIDMPVRITDVLSQLTAELEGSDIEAVMMPLALPWCESNLHRSQRTWPAIEIVLRFVELIKQMPAKNPVADYAVSLTN